MQEINMETYLKNRKLKKRNGKNRYHNMSEEDRNKLTGKYKNLSEEDKNKKREYAKNRYHNMSEEKKQKLKEHQKKYREAKKSKYNNK